MTRYTVSITAGQETFSTVVNADSSDEIPGIIADDFGPEYTVEYIFEAS